MNNKIIARDMALGFFMALALMFIIAFLVYKFKYPFLFPTFAGVRQVYVALLGFGFFGNIALYGLFWYLGKEYIQRGILVLTMLVSLVIIANKFL
ncbi:MAG: hypothetical protein LRY27_04150 [Chitinophagales bacterium]|nr:hypothetical protein [Chitinophagales bacterium]